jgi:hypothetical protein
MHVHICNMHVTDVNINVDICNMHVDICMYVTYVNIVTAQSFTNLL